MIIIWAEHTELKTRTSRLHLQSLLDSYGPQHKINHLLHKKDLKGTGFMITESLTPRLSCIKEREKLRASKRIYSFWTIDGNVFVKKESNST